MPSSQTKLQISELEIKPGFPLIITDADEVIVELFIHLFEYFDIQGYRFKGHSLIGFEIMNFLHCKTDDAIIKTDIFVQIMDDFFRIHAATMPLVQDAYDSLIDLSKRCQIIILTNAPHDYREERTKIFSQHGLNFPIITNQGNKLAAVTELVKHHKAPVFFIDDSPEHHIAILDNIAHIDCIHFIGDKRYAKFVAAVDNIHFESTSWNEVVIYIKSQLKLKGSVM